MSDENGINDWDGKERRDCPGCRNVAELENRVTRCKEQFDYELKLMNTMIGTLQGEFHGFRTDMIASVDELNKSMSDIAHTLRQLRDLPEAWDNLRGFLAVTSWFKQNIVVIVVLVGICIYALKSLKVIE